MRVIDAHMHVDLAGYDTRSIINAMDRKGISTSWLLTWEELHPAIPALHMDLLPEPILEACSQFPDRFVPFYAPDPAAPRLEQQFESFHARGIRGCGELKVSRKWEDPVIEHYLQLVQKQGLALIFHMENPRKQYIQEREGFLQWVLERLLNDKYNGVSRYYITRFAEQTGILKKKIRRNQVDFPGILYDFASLEERIQQFPAIRFIGHGPDFWNHISNFQHPKYIHQRGSIKEFGVIDRLLEAYENLYCDISGTSGYNAMKRDPRQSRNFLQKHASKILFGTDNTTYPLRELLDSMKLGNAQMEMILHKNAEKVLD